MDTSTPAEISAIINAIQTFLELPTNRPTYKKVADDSREIESKIHIDEPEDVVKVLEILSDYQICGAEHRSELHHVFAMNDGSHIARIAVAGMNGEWLKIKSKNTPLITPKYGFAAVTRKANKLRLGDIAYKKYYETTSGAPLVSFRKECINFFYTYQQCVYSLSLSLAWNNAGFLRREMEFEYEGTAAGAQQPALPEEELFENMLRDILPERFLAKLHSETKFESLSKLLAEEQDS